MIIPRRRRLRKTAENGGEGARSGGTGTTTEGVAERSEAADTRRRVGDTMRVTATPHRRMSPGREGGRGTGGSMAMMEGEAKKAAGIMIGRSDDSIDSIRFPSTDVSWKERRGK